jgi:hypothetical protein
MRLIMGVYSEGIIELQDARTTVATVVPRPSQLGDNESNEVPSVKDGAEIQGEAGGDK